MRLSFLAGLAYSALERPRAVAGVLAGLLLLCRLDLVILVGPALLYVALQLRHQRRELALLVAGVAVPVGAWAVWAHITYGYILPSTLAAKTNSEIPTSELVGRGFEYIDATLRYDPLLLLGVFIAVLLVVKGSTAVRLWVLGTVLYSGYVVVIGGDYLLGRFQLLPMMALLLSLTATDLPPARRSPLFWIAPVVALAVAIPTTRVLDFGMHSPPRSSKDYFQDERFWFVRGRALDPLGAITVIPSPCYPVDLAFMDEVAKSWPEGQVFTGQVETVCHGLGGYAFFQPPSVHIIDPCGLADRFMASLPFQPTGF